MPDFWQNMSFSGSTNWNQLLRADIYLFRFVLNYTFLYNDYLVVRYVSIKSQFELI